MLIQRNFYLKNKENKTFKEKRSQYRKKQYQKNREKSLEYQREYRLKKKNEKEILQNKLQFDKGEGNEFDIPLTDDFNFAGKLPLDCEKQSLQADNDEGTYFVNSKNNDCESKGKEPVKENVQLDQGNILLQNDNSIKSSHKDEGSSVNPQKADNEDKPMSWPYDQENVHIEHRTQQNDLNDVDYLNFLYDLNFLDNQNFF